MKLLDPFRVQPKESTNTARLRLLYVIPFYVTVFLFMVAVLTVAASLDTFNDMVKSIKDIYNHDPRKRVVRLRSLFVD